MERFCGMLQSGLHSRSQPWANLDNRVLQMSYVGQLSARHDLQAELENYNGHHLDGLRRNEKIYPDCV
jgi:hypothetical protein